MPPPGSMRSWSRDNSPPSPRRIHPGRRCYEPVTRPGALPGRAAWVSALSGDAAREPMMVQGLAGIGQVGSPILDRHQAGLDQLEIAEVAEDLRALTPPTRAQRL